MSEIRLRISSDGIIAGLYNDALDWQTLGPIRVERASYVEFDGRSQQWTVQIGQPRRTLRDWLQRPLRRPFGEIVHHACTRSEALEWEWRHFGPGGPGWPKRGIRICAIGETTMGFLQRLLRTLTALSRPRQPVRSHTRNQAHGRRWSRHRRRRIEQYVRKPGRRRIRHRRRSTSLIRRPTQ